MEQQCCPPFVPDAWHDKELTWTNKRFAKDDVFCLFYMPVGFGHTMKRLMSKLERAKAASPDWLCLSDHTSRWNMDVFLAVDRDLPDAQMCDFSGRFLARVYEGPFQDSGKWCADYSQHARDRGVETEKLFMWYTTCPECAKKYGKNYVVIVGRIKQ